MRSAASRAASAGALLDHEVGGVVGVSGRNPRPAATTRAPVLSASSTLLLGRDRLAEGLEVPRRGTRASSAAPAGWGRSRSRTPRAAAGTLPTWPRRAPAWSAKVRLTPCPASPAAGRSLSVAVALMPRAPLSPGEQSREVGPVVAEERRRRRRARRRPCAGCGRPPARSRTRPPSPRRSRGVRCPQKRAFWEREPPDGRVDAGQGAPERECGSPWGSSASWRGPSRYTRPVPVTYMSSVLISTNLAHGGHVEAERALAVTDVAPAVGHALRRCGDEDEVVLGGRSARSRPESVDARRDAPPRRTAWASPETSWPYNVREASSNNRRSAPMRGCQRGQGGRDVAHQ